MKDYFDTNSVLKKAKRYYESGRIQKAYMEQEELFPLKIPLRKVTQQAIKKHYGQIIASIKVLERSSLPCEYKTFRFPSIGEQRLPVAVLFSERGSYLKIIGKESSFEHFCSEYDTITSMFPALKDLLQHKPLLVEQESGKWERLLAICHFFLTHPRPGLYIRELAIAGVDTKFVESNKKTIDLLLIQLLDKRSYDSIIGGFQNYGFERKYGLRYPQPQIRFRILDPDLHLCGLSDLALPIEDFATLNLRTKHIFIIENKVTFLSFPPLPESIAIFGSGYGVSYLAVAEWLNTGQIYYWGDIDTHGFAILSRFRSHFENVSSLLMDDATAEKYANLSVEEPKSSRFEGRLEYLSDAERDCFEKLKRGEYGEYYRLEQERIPFEYVREKVWGLLPVEKESKAIQ